MTPELPSKNIIRLYKHRLELDKPVKDYLKRWPSLEEKPKEENKEVKSNGKKPKR